MFHASQNMFFVLSNNSNAGSSKVNSICANIHRGFFALLVSLLSTAVSPSSAATIEKVGSPSCTLRLSGVISNGDSERFKSVLKQPVGSILCLDSPGGNLAEAIKIADTIRQAYDLSTNLEEGSSCLSACALIFMMGHIALGDGDGHLSRHMHYSAELGFHRPKLDLELPDLVDGKIAKKTFEVALDAALDFLRLSSVTFHYSGHSNIERDLNEKIFSTPDDQMYLIDTVGKAGHWDIRVYGFHLPAEIDLVAAQYAAKNTLEWPDYLNDQSSEIYGYRLNGVIEKNYFRAFAGGDMDGSYYDVRWSHDGIDVCRDEDVIGCLSQAKINAATARKLEIYLDGQSYSRGDRFIAIFSPTTRLRDINRAANAIEARAASGPSISLATEGSELRNTCVLKKPDLKVTNVNEFVNLRSGPRLSDRIVAAAPLGTDLTFAGDIRVSGSGPVQKCHDLCVAAQKDALSSADQTALNSCYEDNLIWYRVQMSSGKSGWVSGKFLDVAN